MSGFEGSFLGRNDRIGDGSRLECSVCWWVYDPQEGDPVWQVPPGTSFAQLPSHWRCPCCDAARHQFMVVDKNPVAAASGAAELKPDTELASLGERLVAAYKRVDLRMRVLPVYRSELPLGVVGPRRCDAGALALLFTPWCMNLLLVSPDGQRLGEGSDREVAFPSGSYRFTCGYLDGVGPIESCSLFSPMESFADAAAVEAVAREALESLFRAEEPDPDEVDRAATGPENPSRRRFLRGGSTARVAL
jgi:[NiFe] hydrogenase assembly HybE family chaperone